MEITRESLLKFALSDDGKACLSQTFMNKNEPSVAEFSKETIAQMRDAVLFVSDPNNKALGLASRQVGNYGSWFVAKLGRPEKVVIVVNPDIIGRNGRKQHIEGCFSEANQAKVKRSVDITVTYWILELISDGDSFMLHPHILERMSGRDAQVFQHEYHHLEGKLLSDVGEVIKNIEQPLDIIE